MEGNSRAAVLAVMGVILLIVGFLWAQFAPDLGASIGRRGRYGPAAIWVFLSLVGGAAALAAGVYFYLRDWLARKAAALLALGLGVVLSATAVGILLLGPDEPIGRLGVAPVVVIVLAFGAGAFFLFAAIQFLVAHRRRQA